MFDIGFPELVLISIVALLILGPERLPDAVRTMALWVGRIRRSYAKLRNEIENEIGADEIRAQLHNEEIMKELEESRTIIKETIQDTGNLVNSAGDDIQEEVDQLDKSLGTRKNVSQKKSE